ncbi:MAG: hypothetical protein H7318_11785 [Oligoflexus sp.]|nr:hypothetical protein [Oligoflexus sp.]
MDKPVVVFAEFAGKVVPTQSLVEFYAQNEIVKKASKALAVCWATAALTIFIPIIHLVLTPIAFIAGPFAALFVFFKVQKLPRLIEGSVVCQHCQKQTHFRFHNMNPRYYEICEHCRTGYEVLWPAKEA